MSAIIGKISHYIGNRLDKLMALGGIFVGLVVTFVLWYLVPAYLGVGVALTISCALYFFLARRGLSPQATPERILPRVNPLVLDIIFFVLFIALVLSLYFSSYQRSVLYFIVAALMSASIGWEIISRNDEEKRSGIILLKILVLALVLRWSLFYIFPESHLGTDPWGNALLFQNISETGHLTAEIGGYYYTPVQHFLVVATQNITGLGIRESMIVSLGLFEVTSIIFIFLLGKSVFGAKVALFAALFLSINNLHIMWGWWLVAQTLGIGFFCFILYLIFNPKTRYRIEMKSILFLALFSLILTHSISSFVTLITMAIIVLSSIMLGRAHRDRPGKVMHVNVFFLYFVVLIGYWIYVAGFFDFFVQMVVASDVDPLRTSWLFSPVVQSDINPLAEQLDKLGTLIYYGLSFIGILATFKKTQLDASRIHLSFVGIFLAIIIFTIFFLLTFEINVGRWFIFLNITLAPLAAYGLMTLVTTLVSRWKRILVTFTTVAALAFLMISNSAAAFDNYLSPEYLKVREALHNSEVAAADTIVEFKPDALVTEKLYYGAFLGMKSDTRLLTDDDVETGFQAVEGLIILRENAETDYLLRQVEGSLVIGKFLYDPAALAEEYRLNHVYDSGTMGGYLNSE